MRNTSCRQITIDICFVNLKSNVALNLRSSASKKIQAFQLVIVDLAPAEGGKQKQVKIDQYWS